MHLPFLILLNLCTRFSHIDKGLELIVVKIPSSRSALTLKISKWLTVLSQSSRRAP